MGLVKKPINPKSKRLSKSPWEWRIGMGLGMPKEMKRAEDAQKNKMGQGSPQSNGMGQGSPKAMKWAKKA